MRERKKMRKGIAKTIRDAIEELGEATSTMVYEYLDGEISLLKVRDNIGYLVSKKRIGKTGEWIDGQVVYCSAKDVEKDKPAAAAKETPEEVAEEQPEEELAAPANGLPTEFINSLTPDKLWSAGVSILYSAWDLKQKLQKAEADAREVELKHNKIVSDLRSMLGSTQKKVASLEGENQQLRNRLKVANRANTSNITFNGNPLVS